MASEIKSLVEIVKIKGGKRLPKGESLQTDENKHPYIRVRDMGGRYIPKNGLEYVPENIFPKISRYIVEENDVIISIVGTVGLVSIIDKYFHKASQTENCAKLSGLSEVDAKYLYYYLISPCGQQEISTYTVGAVQPKLPLYGIESISVPWFKESKRAEIAHILGSLDNKIELNRQMNETLEAMAQALFKSWFVDFDPVIDNALAAGNAIPDTFAKRAEQRKGIEKKDHSDTQNLFPDEFEFTDEMGWIPKGWEVKESGDLFDVRDGTHDSPKKSDEGKYLITSRHITSGVIDYPNAYLISQDDFNEVNKRSLVESYDILITMIGTVGVSMLVLQDEIDFAIKNVGLFKTSNNKSYAVFFYLYLNSNYMTQFLDSRLAGTTQKYLTLKVLRALPVVTPDNKTLSHFVNNMSPIFKKIHSNHEQIGILAKLRDTLLPKLMSGEIRISDAEALVEYV